MTEVPVGRDEIHRTQNFDVNREYTGHSTLGD